MNETYNQRLNKLFQKKKTLKQTNHMRKIISQSKISNEKDNRS